MLQLTFVIDLALIWIKQDFGPKLTHLDTLIDYF